MNGAPHSYPPPALGEKYRFLLQLPKGARVAVSGPYFDALLPDLTADGLRAESVPAERTQHSTEDPWDGLLVDVGDGVLGTQVWPGLAEMATRAKTALALVRWRYLPLGWVETRTRKAFAIAGQSDVRGFTPAPDLRHVEAFVADPRDSDWRLHQSVPRRLVREIAGPERQRLFFARRPAAGSGLETAERLLVEATGETGFTVERYHIRSRGALVLVLRDLRGSRRVMRVATNEAVAGLAGRNQQGTVAVLQVATFPDRFKALIPPQVGRFRSEEVEVFIEEFRPGRLAWTLYRDPETAQRIDSDLYQFSHALQSASRVRRSLTGPDLDCLLAGLLGSIESRLGPVSDLGPRLAALRMRLQALLENREFSLCFAHGDYGVGNALVSHDGRVTGIIDWDQSIEEDFPGLDWCNYKLKAAHFLRPLRVALANLVEESTSTGWLASRFGGFGTADFGLTRVDLLLIPCLAALRDLARSARFPGELTQRPEHYRALLDQVGDLLASAE